MQADPAFASISSLNYKNILLLSLGTGTSSELHDTYTAEEAARWGALRWIFHNGSSPLIRMGNRASSYMNDYYISTLFQALNAQNNYLRIQVRPTNYYFIICISHFLS